MNSKIVIILGRGRVKKYFKINYNYELVDNSGMFFVGIVIYFLDFRKFAGGFIYGFRYIGENLGLFFSWCIVFVWIYMVKIDYKIKIDYVYNVYLCNLYKFEFLWLELIMMFDILIVYLSFLLNFIGINFYFLFLYFFIYFL